VKRIIPQAVSAVQPAAVAAATTTATAAGNQ
jgi:hypothetical protein